MNHSAFMLLLKRDLALFARRRLDSLLPAAFFIIAASLFPLGVGPEAQTLRHIAPGIIWVCALLSTMLSMGALFANDHADGSLEQMIVSGRSLAELSLAKTCAHWITTGLPLVLLAPLMGLLFDMDSPAIALLALTLLLGTPSLSLLGGLGSALTLGLSNAGVLLLLLVLPLCIPVLIFGSGAIGAFEAGVGASGHISLLAAILLLCLVGCPFATAAALRISTS